MNILCTVPTGHIGSHTTALLADAGHQVVRNDDFCNSPSADLQRLQSLSSQTMLLIEGEVRATPVRIQNLKTHQISAVIHFAGLKAVGRSAAKRIDYYVRCVKEIISLLPTTEAARVM